MAGPRLTYNAQETVESGESVVLATVTPTYPGEGFFLSQYDTDDGLLSLEPVPGSVDGAEYVVFTAPSTIDDSLVEDAHFEIVYGGGAVPGEAAVTLDPGPQLVEENSELFVNVGAEFSEGDGPVNGLAVADLGNGSPDIIVADYADDDVDPGYVVVSTNEGGGSFAPGVTYAVGVAPEDVATADLTGDGRQDIIVADVGANLGTSGDVQVLYNEGGGSFAPAVTYAAGPNPLLVTTADLTGDGRQDIVVANYNGGVSVLLNQGDGHFASAVSFGAENIASGLTTADLTGNGLPDIIATDANGGLFVLMNEGDGSFAPAVSYYAGTGDGNVTTADLTGNGLQDIIVADTSDQALDIFMNEGDGSFAPAVTYFVTGLFGGLTTADLTGNGLQDIIVEYNRVGNSQDNGIAILFNKGGGVFDPPSYVGLVTEDGAVSAHLATSDLTGDGRPDIVVGNRSGNGEILVNDAATQGPTLSAGQTTVLGTVTPGEPGDTLSLTDTISGGGGTVSLSDDQVIYAAPAGVSANASLSISYIISDQHDDTTAQGYADVELAATPTLQINAPGAVEKSQTYVLAEDVAPGNPADKLTLTQTGQSDGGVVTLSGGDVIYTAPAAIAASGVDTVSYTIAESNGGSVSETQAVTLDAGPTLSETTTQVDRLEASQSVVLGDVTPGEAGDTLSVTGTFSGGGGTVSLVDDQVVYTAPASVPADASVTVGYTISDQHDDATAQGGAVIGLLAQPPTVTLIPKLPTLEEGQTTELASRVAAGHPGDTLTLTQTGATDGGVVTFVGGVLKYTAPATIAASGADTVSYTIAESNGASVSETQTVTLDAGPLLTVETQSPTLTAGQTAVLGDVTPGEPGDTLSLTDTVGAGGGTVSLSNDQVIYTAPADIPADANVEVSYGVSDQHDDATALGGADVALEASAACYARGTRILTARGEVAVEDLSIGDRVRTASGAIRPIRWIGRRRIDCARHPDPAAVWPVRVRAGAFDEGQPRHDLWLSPGHNVAFVGALMPILVLVNGVSIARERRDRIEYWHVELDVHDVILAEGLPAESYLDCGNRAAFENGGAVIEAFPDFAPKHWSQTCLPLVERGPEVAATRSWLASRLRARGYALTGEDDAHVVADGRRIEPFRLAPARLTFLVPEGARRVALRSRVFSPAGTTPDSADTRELGLGLSRLRIDGADVDLANDAALGAGWHAAEIENGAFARRWTRGEVDLPAGTRRVVVDLAEQGLYWRAPGDDVAARSA